MSRSATESRCVLALALCVCALYGCREFPVNAWDTEGEGDAGEPGPCADIPGRFAECDNSSLERCETDLSLNPYHCGGCRQNCDHACFDGECLSSEPLLTGVSFHELRDSMIVADRHIYALGVGANGDRLFRIGRDSGEVETLLLDLPSTTAFALGLDRIYLQIDDAIHSVPLGGGTKLEVEVASDVDFFVVHEGTLFWTTDDGFLRTKTSFSGELNTLGKKPEGLDMLVAGPELLLGVASQGETFRLLAWNGELDTFVEFASGTGLVERARVFGAMAYVLVDDGSWALLGYPTNESAVPVRFDSPHHVRDFEASEGFVYLAWEGGPFSGVDVIPIENPDYLIPLGTDVFPIDMAVAGSDLYYLKFFPRNIYHIDLKRLH